MPRLVNVVFWSPHSFRRVKTKKRGMEVLRAWKRWKERNGWFVKGSSGRGYVAFAPDFEMADFFQPELGKVQSVGLRALTPEQWEELNDEMGYIEDDDRWTDELA